LIQSQWLGMVALGDNTRPDPNKGTHLRWAFERRLGFPPGGFDLFRRPHFSAAPVCVTLQGHTANQNLGKHTTLGDLLLESDADIRTVEFVAAGGASEIDLRNKPPLSIRPHEVCHRIRVYTADLSAAGGTIQAIAYDGNVPVSSDKTVASQGVQYLDLTADRIDRVVVSSSANAMNGVLSQICFTTVAADAFTASPGWTRLNQTPICLPLSDPRYPSACRLPNKAQEWPTAGARIPDNIGSYMAEFPSLRKTLARIYNPSDAPLTAGREGAPKFVHDPLGIVLLTTLDPYIARMLGLYWIDGAFYVGRGLQGPAAATVGTAYDYMVTAHYPQPVEAEVDLEADNLPGGDLSFVVYNVVLGAPPALPAPSRLGAAPLPVLTSRDRAGNLVRGQMAAGLLWDRDLAGDNLLPGGAILYDLQRQGLGNGNAPRAINPAAWVMAKPNLLVASNSPGSICEPFEPLPGWPAGRPDCIDLPPGTQQRWYAYRVRGTDIFGRKSGYRELASVDLKDTIPPPPPADVRAKYLDPDDPTMTPGERAWAHPASGPRHGLRVSWRWSENLQQQAPDAAQFRVYLKRGRRNVVLGNVTAVGAPDGQGNARLTTDVVAANLPAGNVADAFDGEWLSQGAHLYQIVASGASGGFLTLTFKRIVWAPIPADGRIIQAPQLQAVPAAGAFSVSVRPPKPLAGRITAVAGRVRVETDVRYMGIANDLAGKKLRQAGRLWEITGNGTGWKFAINLRARECDPEMPDGGQQFAVVAADGVTPHLLDAGNPHWRDYREPRNWEQRLHLEPRTPEPTGAVTAAVDNGNGTSTVTTDQALNDASRHFIGGELQMPTLIGGQKLDLTWPVIGLTTEGNFRLTVLNNARERGTGRVRQMAPPANTAFIYWPDIVIPLKSPLAIAPGQPAAYAAVGVSAADNKAYAADQWPSGGQPGNEGRVSPPAIIARPERSAPPRCETNADVLMATPADFLGHSSFWVRWSKHPEAGLRYQVYRALTEPNGDEPPRERYRLLTPEPLQPDDDTYGDIAEPGHAPANLNLMAYHDILDGKSTSRYYYRVRAVNAAGTRSDWSDAIGPVACPDVVPPRPPVITKVLGGDQQITLRWASSREPDLAEYRVYRAETKEASEDLRLMRLVHMEAETREPAERPAEVEWNDRERPGVVTFYYRVVAVDAADNVSAPSPAVAGRAHDLARPEPPTWEQAQWLRNQAGQDVIRLVWVVGEPGMRCIVQRKATDELSWRSVTGWLVEPIESRPGPPEAWAFAFEDETAQTHNSYRYQVKVVNQAGNTNAAVHTTYVARRVA
jgi:hypothetical protein